MRKSYIADSIMREYEKKKRYETKIKLQKFHRQNCINCKNRLTDKCDIRKDIQGNLKCVYYEV